MEGEDEERYSDPPSPTLSSPPPYRDFFDRERHLTYLQMMYQMLPCHYQKQEINRLTLAYFVISGLDILGALQSVRLLPVFILDCALTLIENTNSAL